MYQFSICRPHENMQKIILGFLFVVLFCPSVGFRPVGKTWGTLPKFLQVMASKTNLPANFFDNCRPVNGHTCEQRYKAVVSGKAILYSEKLLLHYLFGNGEVISEFPSYLEEEIRFLCGSEEAKTARKENKIQISGYQSSNEEFKYSLGSFGCVDEGDYYRVIDTWKVDPPKPGTEDDLMEGGNAASMLESHFCRPKGGCKPFPIFVRIPK